MKDRRQTNDKISDIYTEYAKAFNKDKLSASDKRVAFFNAIFDYASKSLPFQHNSDLMNRLKGE